jgi:hypothetical protein
MKHRSTSSDLRLGFNPELDIPSALRALESTEVAINFILISVVDSTYVPEVVDLVPLLTRHRAFHSTIGDDLLIDISGLRLLLDEEFFTGFDELALCSEMPQSGKPRKYRVTSDRSLESVPSDLAEWMRDNNAIAVLGDGVGLNFATLDARVAATLSASA